MLDNLECMLSFFWICHFNSIDVYVCLDLSFELVFLGFWPLMDGFTTFGRSMARLNDGWMVIEVLLLFYKFLCWIGVVRGVSVRIQIEKEEFPKSEILHQGVYPVDRPIAQSTGHTKNWEIQVSVNFPISLSVQCTRLTGPCSGSTGYTYMFRD